MKEFVYKCDRCGEAIAPMSINRALDLDFCEKCYEELVMNIQCWIDEPEPAAIKETEKLLRIKDVRGMDEAVGRCQMELEAKRSTLTRKNTLPGKIKEWVPDDFDWDYACKLKSEGWKPKEIAEYFNVPVRKFRTGCFYKYLNDYKSRAEGIKNERNS